MKILVVSDTHRQLENLRKVLEKETGIDLMIHLGDVEGQESQIREMAGCPVEMVAGNGDYFSGLDTEKTLWLGKNRVLITHGHYYKVTLGTMFLLEEAVSRNFQIALFGHTHRPVVESASGVVIANPGSLTYPRQEGWRPSYLVMEMDEKEDVHFLIKYL